VLRAIVSMQLIERVDGRGLMPVVEVLVNSPKIAKQIETGETKEILEEVETSVAYFKMQSMNQSLIALLVNGAIDVDAAMKLSTDPEDLSLKLRKLFPKIEERGRGGIMASANDFSAITELMDIKRLYEEQEEKWRQRVSEKDEIIASLEHDIEERERQVQAKAQQGAEAEGEIQRLRADSERQRQEMAAKVAQLNERIRELNQKLIGTGGAPAVAASPAGQQGFFKR
ncbi:MAG TPA: hypothetical protein VMN04_05380, partial [Thermoanaerobaculia bacterium]|nr:hypothetical protein [Thermoanaerobaculia bacterium]